MEQGKLKTKIGTTALSAAVLSGLLLSGTAAQAAETSDEVVVSPVQTTPAQEVAPLVTTPVVEAVAPAAETIVPETVIAPVEPETTPVGEEPVASPAPEPSTEATPEALETAPTAEETAAATDDKQPITAVPEAKTATPTEVSPSAQTSESSTYGGVEDEDPRWDELDALLPEGSEDWEDAQWEAFEKTEDGQEYIRLIEEIFAEENFEDEDSEFSDEELAFWESIDKYLPEDSWDWDETQWEDFFRTDSGLELIKLLLPSIVEGIEGDDDAAELQAFLEEVFANDPELRAYYLELYFGIKPDDGAVQGDGSGDEEILIPSESERPVASAEIKPAADLSKAPVAAEKAANKVAESTTHKLANTGFNGVLAAGLGLLLALAGAAFVARGRKNATK